MRSRLNTNIKKQNTKTLIGIVIILTIIVLFGMKFLVGYSIILEKFRNQKDNTSSNKTVDYIAPPILDPVSQATNSAKVKITGTSPTENTIVKLYLNDKYIDNVEIKNNNSFVFGNISLIAGKNVIKAKAFGNDELQSEYSQSITINYLNKLPQLDVTFPHDGTTFKKDESPIRIIGKTDPGVKVTINDFWAISQDDGNFSYQYNLKDGDNNLKVVATDEAGNKSEKEIKIKVE